MKTLLHKSIFSFYLILVLSIGTVIPSRSQMTNRQVSPLGTTVSSFLPTDSLSSLSLYGVTYKKIEDSVLHSQLQSPGNRILHLIGNPGAQNCFHTCIKKTVLRIEFDAYGDNKDFRHATAEWNSIVHIQVYLGGSSSTSYDFYLTISNTQPHQVFEQDITNVMPGTMLCPNSSNTDYTVNMTYNYDSPPPTNINVEPDIRLRVKLISETQVDPNSTSYALGHETFIKPILFDNPIRLEWETHPPSSASSCPDVPYVPNYQIQLLKLYNISDDPTAANNENKIKAVVDWKNALTFETYSPIQLVDLTLAEGRGFYVWRIRLIGNKEEGGIANPKNYGDNDWNENSIEDGAEVEIERNIVHSPPTNDMMSLVNGISSLTIDGISKTSTISDYSKKGVFFYCQFDSDRNWIFSRTFTEGSTEHGPQFNEKIVYANRLLQPVQQQVALQSKDNVLVSYTGYDFSGRPVLKTLPAALPSRELSYVKSILSQSGNDQLYSAFDFDNSVNGNTMQTNAASQTDLVSPTTNNPAVPSIGSYYSSTNTDLTIPSAEGYPFTRTIYASDPLGRVAEQSGVGGDFLIGSNKTIRTQYSSTPEGELLSIFGDEAPKNTSTFKTITTDPNGVSSVAYTTADGKTVATCLIKNTISSTISNTNPLSELLLYTENTDGERINTVSVVDSALGNFRMMGQDKYSSSTSFVLTKETNCTLDYDLVRKQISSDCPSLCKTCDYEITLSLTKENQTTPILLQNISANTVECSANVHLEEQPTIPPLGPGKYTLSRIIRANPLVTVNGITKTRLETYIDDLTNELADATELTLSTIFGARITDHYLKPKIVGSTEEPDDYFTALYEELLKNYVTYRNNKALNSYITSLVSPPSPATSFTCSDYDIVLQAPDPDCASPCTSFNPNSGNPEANPNFAQLLTGDPASYFKQPIFTATDAGLYPDNPPCTTTIVEDAFTHLKYKPLYNIPLFGTTNVATIINRIIGDMLRSPEGYSCTKLWRCWQGAVKMYNLSTKELNFPPPDDGSPEDKTNGNKYKPKDANAPSSKITNKDFDLLESFLDCAGRKLCRVSADPVDFLANPHSVLRIDGEYNDLYRQCKYDIYKTLDPDDFTNPLYCDANSTDPDRTNKVHANLEQIWQCMKGKIHEAKIRDRIANDPNSIEARMDEDIDEAAKKELPTCCLPPIDIVKCKEELEKQTGGACAEECVRESIVARESLIKQYEDAHYLLQDKWYNINGGYIPGPNTPLPTEPYTYLYLSKFTLNCLVANVLEYCKNECKLTIEIEGAETVEIEDDHIISVGTPEELANRNKVFSSAIDVVLSADQTSPYPTYSCPPEYDEKVGNSANLTDMLVTYLNDRIDDMRKTITQSPGEWKDVYPIMKELYALYAIDTTTCRNLGIFKDGNAYLFIDKAAPGYGRNKFFKYEVQLNPQVTICKVAFKHDVKKFDFDRTKIPVNVRIAEEGSPINNEVLDGYQKDGIWKRDYDKYLENALTDELNNYIRVTWASHQPLSTNINGDPPHDASTSTTGFFQTTSCSLFKQIFPNDNVYPWFYRWDDNPHWPFQKQYLHGKIINPDKTINHLFYVDNQSSWFIENGQMECINGSDYPVPINQIVSYFSTLDYAFQLKDPSGFLWDWAFVKSSPISPLLGKPYSHYAFASHPGYQQTDNDYSMYLLFTQHVYLGKIGITIKDPNPDLNNVQPPKTLEIWMDNELCGDGTGQNCPNIFSPNFKLHLRVDGVNGFERVYNIPYPSATFDKLVYYGYPDPLGCEYLPERITALYKDFYPGDYINIFDVIGGFYINDDGYLAFDDKEGGIGTENETEPDFVFSNIRLNCRSTLCMIDTIDAFCIPCNQTASCGNICARWVKRPQFTGTLTKFRVRGCEETEVERLIGSIYDQINDKHRVAMSEIRNLYTENCINPANIKDSWTASYGQQYYHYTLYYYDRAGRLVKTIPPKGVRPIPAPTPPATYQRDETDHKFPTLYKYNSLGQMIWQSTPDGGETNFWYDNKGKLRLSQNAKQAAVSGGAYSYTKYDDLYRIVDVGEAAGTPSQGIADNPELPTSGINEFTHTYYSDPPSAATTPTVDLPAPFSAGGLKQRTQRFLLNRVSWTETKPPGSNDYTRSFYSYDPHGNVEWLIQDIPGLGASVIDYDYDLISGKVTEVSYQKDFKDRYFHRYQYDQDNRIVSVETSKDRVIWEKDADYNYYLHGPLRRSVTGQDRVQGTDYTYTVQGWLKAMNFPIVSSILTPSEQDPGKDGYGATWNSNNVGADAFGMSLTYYNGDFKHTGSQFEYSSSGNNAASPPITAGLYNGNIAGWVTDYRKATGVDNTVPLTGLYTYDLLNRIRVDAPKKWDFTSWVNTGYGSTYNYDPNGNITGLTRQDNDANGPQTIDNLTYTYIGETNRLNYIDDLPTNSNKVGYDLDQQLTGNYSYDEIGNLTGDTKEGISSIVWTAGGKVSKVIKSNGTEISFYYDGMGNRIRKFVDVTGTANDKTTWYVRDASGNVMSTYEKLESVTHPTQIEVPLYGSDRLGMWKPGLLRNNNNGGEFNIASVPDPPVYTRNHDGKLYELKDHLGNVRVVIRDWKVNGATSIRSFIPKIVSYSGYYPFGMQMHEDTWESPLYRYGYNGKEKDGEIKGEGNSYDYGFRIYDPRIGKFISVDPLTKDYPELTPYQYASDSPISCIDIDGLEGQPINELWKRFAAGVIKLGNDAANTVAGKTAIAVGGGVQKSLTKTYNFVSNDMWQGETWKQTAQLAGEVALVANNPALYAGTPFTPKLNAAAQSVKDGLTKGDIYDKIEFVSEIGTDVLTGIVGTKGISSIVSAGKGLVTAARVGSTVAKSAAIAEGVVEQTAVRSVAASGEAAQGAATGVTISDNAFVHVTTPSGAASILENGLDPAYSSYVTKWGYIKNVTNPSDFNTMLYSQKLWPEKIGKFDNGFTVLEINAKPSFYSPRTNWVNGVPQYKFNEVIPPSQITPVTGQ